MLLKFAVKDFLSEKKFKNLSSYTLDSYSRILRIFTDYCLTQSVIKVTEVKRSDVKQFLYYCQEDLGNANSTINQKIRTLKAFFNYCDDEEIITENPTKKIRQSKDVTRIEIPSDQEVKQLVKYWERKGYKYGEFNATRNRMLIIFFISTGARLGEARNLRWRDIDFDSHTIQLFGKKRQVESIPMTIQLKKEFMEFVAYSTKRFGKLGDHVFTTTGNTQLCDDTIGSVFKRMKEALQPDYRLSCHTLRHWYTHKLIKAGASNSVVKQLLRHETTAMSERYHALWSTDMREEAEKFNTLRDIDF